MVSSSVSTVKEYLASLPADRRQAVAAVREVVNRNLPAGFKEGMLYGMIGWYVPLERFPVTYNGQPLALAALASQKSHLSLYLMAVYGDPALAAEFEAGFAAAGKRLNMGKSCVRFRKLEDLPLDVIGDVIRRVGVEELIAAYEAARAGTKGAKKEAAARERAAATEASAATAKSATKKSAKKKASATAAKPAAKKASAATAKKASAAKSVTAEKASAAKSTTKKSSAATASAATAKSTAKKASAAKSTAKKSSAAPAKSTAKKSTAKSAI